ncbi:fibronectin type 3 and ankyrin repeat domains protein 1 [Ostrinia furnacalis]|uniref:fibronectin type 3 and ankyrin repeat domains protein 1 n=1 Tax=Ostrinia furnacalis TaxID=93504 RepID=UPI00103B1A46|nr:fibronectin type 3 and ankyrin repeat domains protein 1 [Ostrinia furnacalis]
MDLQSALSEAFEAWQPRAPEVTERTKCSILLEWPQDGPFEFLSGDFLYRLERNEKIPPWVVAYSGGKTSKLIDYLAPRHPYRFRLKVILKATALPSLSQKALEHYGSQDAVIEKLKELRINKSSEVVCEDNFSREENTERIQEHKENHTLSDDKPLQKQQRKWLESQWSEEVWTSTDTDGTSAVCFCMAVRCGYLKQIQVMLEEKPSLIGTVNSTNGFTPLATAVRKGDINTVRLLVSSGAELDQPSATGQTPLHLAVLGSHTAIVEYLLDWGADFEARDLNGLRVEHYAVDSCNLETLRLVLARGGDLTATDNNGWTPLFRALCQGAKSEIIEELVQRGSDVEIRDHAGLPLTSVARLLKNRHGRSRDSILRLVDSQYPHEKALANFTRLTKKIYNVHTLLK